MARTEIFFASQASSVKIQAPRGGQHTSPTAAADRQRMELLPSSMSLHDDGRIAGLLGGGPLGSGGGQSDENPQEAPPLTLSDALLADTPLPNNEEETFIQKYLSRIITAMLALALVGLVFVLMPIYAVHAAKNERWNETLYWTAGAFVLIAVPVSAYGIVQHLVNVSVIILWVHVID